MKILIIGGGGREHALAWKAAQSPLVEQVLVAPGNAGTASERKICNVAIAVDDAGALLDLASREAVDLTIVGPEGPLVSGIVDAFEGRGLRCFGPSRLAAQLEGSKAYCKAFLDRHGIRTAAYQTFSDINLARRYIRELGAPLVVKADGLAAGKGVVVARSVAEADAAAEQMLSGLKFGAAGSQVVIEQFLSGEEASFIVMVDGEDYLPFASSQDHKPRDDADLGPNTGGMGAYSPAPVIDRALNQRVLTDVIEPTVRGLAADGHRYRGFLYAGLMVEKGVPHVLEYNCRLGDPETQPILMRLRSDIIALCLAATQGRLGQCSIEWDSRPALGVVMAAGGYPDSYRQGDPITGLDAADGLSNKVFHAGTQLSDSVVCTAGGRVLCATALGVDIADAQLAAYDLAGQIRWDDVFYRRDIGYRAVARLRAAKPENQ